MNKSLRIKLSIFLTCFVLTTVLGSICFSNIFLEDYLVYGKQKALENAFDVINRLYNTEALSQESEEIDSSIFGSLRNPLGRGKGTTSDGNIPDIDASDVDLRLEKLGQSHSISILVYKDWQYYDPLTNTQYAYKSVFSSVSIGKEDDTGAETNHMYDDYKSAKETSVMDVKGDKNYTMEKVYVNRLGSDYIYLSGTLDNGNYVLLRASLDSISESVALSNQFYLYVAFGMFIIGFIVVFYISKQFTQPILELAGIASKMSDLDFSAKYEVTTDDEIAVLGNSINILSEKLEHTLAELKTANAELRKDLENRTQIDEMRKEFLSNVSHELKTPIALIQGYAEGLNENISDDAESREFYCDVIMDEASKMNVLVKKLLDLNQLEFGNNQVNMERFDIVEVVGNILSNSDILFKQKEVQLVFDRNKHQDVWGDVYMVEEIFSNYMTNALNHVDGERRIQVEIINKKDVTRISVFNTGEEIPKEDIDSIWIKFYKVDKARTREYGGSGVGLSIVKASMDLLGQNYGVTNKGNGVEFWFELESA